MGRAPSKPQARPRVERRLALDGPRAAIEALAGRDALGPLVLGPARTTQLREVYYDTRGGALADAGVTLSVSARAERFAQRVEERGAALAVGFAERALSEARLASSDPEPTRVARVRTLCGDGKLNAQLEIEGTLTTRRVSFERAAIALRLEVGEARSVAGALPIARVVLVLQRGSLAALFRAALLLLAEHPELRPALEDTAALLVRARGAAPVAAPPIALPRNASLRALVDAALAACLRSLSRSEAAVRLAPEPEAIHGMRVAVRRFRSALRLLRAELGRARAERLRDALSPLSDALGEVRDLDVLLTRISACEGRGAPPLAELRTRVASERERALAALRGLLESPERAQLDLELGLLAFGHVWCEAASADRLAAPATEAARSLAEHADSRPRRAGRDLATLTPEERHRLRLRVKAARYAVELLAPLLPRKRALRYVRRARALQDALGVECDALRVRTIALRLGEAAAVGTDFLLGYGAGQADQSRAERDRAWRRFRRARRP